MKLDSNDQSKQARQSKQDKQAKRDKIIRILDWGRLCVGLMGLLVILYAYVYAASIDYDFVFSNVLAIYVLFMGIKTYIIGKNITMAWFYMFFSALMLVAINMIKLRFG